MLLIAEIIFMLMLIMALITLIIEEGRIKQSKVPKGMVEEYWQGEERRKSVRINSSFIVKYIIEKKLHIKINGQTKDISEDGMRLLINEKLNTGTLLFLEFNLPDTKKMINAEASVVWAGGQFNERSSIGRRVFHTGVRFLNINAEDKNRLVNYIQKITQYA